MMNHRQASGLIFLGVLLVLSVVACSSDPCVYAPDSPSCDAQRAVTKATIAAVSADQAAGERQAAMRATQDAISLRVQATQGAINSRATADSVAMAATQGARLAEAQATQAAVNNRATSQAVSAAATQSAIGMQATVQAISASATQTALEGKVKIDEAQQRANAAGLREGLYIALGILIVVGLSVGFLWYARRMAVAVTHAATVRAATVRIGQDGTEVLFALPRADGKLDIVDPRQLVGAHMLSDGRGQPSDATTPEELFRWLALLEHAKRNQLITLAEKLGALPGSSLSDEASTLLPERAGQPFAMRYEIVAGKDQPPLLAADPRAVEVLDAEWRKVND
jgi:hypothetical protein